MAFLPRLKGFLFLLAVSVVIYCGSVFFLPQFLLCLLLPWGGQLSSLGCSYVTSTFFKFVSGLLEVVFGVQVKICGDGKKLEGPCLLIMNHRTRFDWLFLWCYLARMGDLKKLKFVLKESLRNIPSLGWALQSNWNIFLSRKVDVDEQRLRDGISHFTDANYPFQLLFFPEGTDLSPSNKENDRHYASKNGLPKYDYVLHPRTKGFALCVQEIQKSEVPPTLVNISVGYVGDMPQNEKELAAGQWPSEIHFFAEQYPLSALPSDERGLGEWLRKCWENKEKQLKLFYASNKFSARYLSDTKVNEVHGELKKLVLVWMLFLVYLAYNAMTNSFYWFYYPIWTTIYLIINHVAGGVDNLYIRRSRLFKFTKRKDKKKN